MTSDAREPAAARPNVEHVRPTDHAWLDDTHGVLSCAAGDQHTSTRGVVCPYYLHIDLLNVLPLPKGAPSDPWPTLTWQGGQYTKISRVASPPQWPAVLRALDPRHGLVPLAWSLFTALDLTPGTRLIDPRDALRSVLSAGASSAALEVLHALAVGLGDPGNHTGVLGLTGSAALDPSRLPGALTGEHDIDLMLYPGALAQRAVDVPEALRSVGAVFPAELSDDDARAQRYRRSRMMPATTSPASAAVFWRRRTDLAWIGDLRLDLTTGGVYQRAEALPYAAEPVGEKTVEVTVAAVGEGYPVRLQVEHPLIEEVAVTARGYQTVFRPGDRLTVTGLWHRTRQDTAYLSVDDCAGHQLTLHREGAP